MRVTIHDEAERRVVLSAIWRHAAAEIGERFYDRLTDEAQAALHPPDDDPPGLLVTREATLLAAVLLGVAEVRAAPVGATVNPSMPDGALRDALLGVAAGITEDEGFWQTGDAGRGRMMANHDAAVRLISRLPIPVEAGA